MGNLVSRTPPWKRLHQPARVSVLSFEPPSAKDIFQYLASHDPARPPVITEIPSIGMILDHVKCDPLTLTTLNAIGVSRPDPSWKKDVDWMRANTDGVLLLVDCRLRDQWWETREEFGWLALYPDELRRCPLLVLTAYTDAEGAMGLDEIERDLRTPEKGYDPKLSREKPPFTNAYPGIKESERSFSIKKYNVSTGEGILEGMEWMVEALNSRQMVEKGGAL